MMCISSLKILSRLPLTIAIMVMVKGEPAIAVAGALMLSIATGVLQPDVSIPAIIATLNAHSRTAHRPFLNPMRASSPENLAEKRTKTSFALHTIPSDRQGPFRHPGGGPNSL